MQLHYEEMGKGENVVILHGLFGMSDNWMTIGERISQRHRVFLIDQRNHGQSPHSKTFNYDVLADDLQEFLDTHGLEHTKIIGHSMGGKVGMNFALQNPERVDKLVVVDIAPRAYDHPYFEKFIKAMMGIDIAAIQNRKDAHMALKEAIPQKAIRNFLLKNLARKADNQFEWKINLSAVRDNLNHIFDAVDSEATFDKPALFVRGEKSNYVNNEDYPHIRKLFTQAKMVTIPKATHWIHAEQPEAFCDHLRMFL
ncbi:MAG: alpha/beta fold hydrolase [Caldithrix sp.]|nr:alpha/beta fold hydrolase [Caldithrix sp.]